MNKSVKKMAYAGLMAALCFLGTMIIYFRTPTGGYLHIGDSMVFLTGALLGPVYGGFAAGIGSMFADLAAGAPMWMPATFLIKFAMAAVMGLFLKKTDKIACIKAIIAMVIGVVLLIAGYYLAELIITQNWLASFIDSAGGNLIQGVSGSIIGFIVMVVFDRTKLTAKIRA